MGQLLSSENTIHNIIWFGILVAFLLFMATVTSTEASALLSFIIHFIARAASGPDV